MASLSASAPVKVEGARPHLKHVEGMRALAALAVYVNHAYAQVRFPGGEYATGLWSPLPYAMVAGHLSVTVFIVISGFCLTLPVVAADGRLTGGTRAFFKRRARRILPPYYGALVSCLLLIGTILGHPTGTLWDVPIQISWKSVVSHFLLLQDFFGTGGINYVFWSIAVEWQLYFLFPLLVASFARFGAARTVSGALLIGLALRLGFASTRLVRANPHYLGLFTLGMLSAHIACSARPAYLALRTRFPWGVLAASALAIVCGLAVGWGVERSTERFYWLDLPTGLLAASVLAWASSPKGAGLARALSWRPLVFIGTFSYSVYLMHAPILQILWQYVLHPTGMAKRPAFGFLMTMGLALTLAATYLFFRVFERPFMRSSRARSTPRAEVEAVRAAG